VRAVALLVTSYSVGTAAGPSLGGWLFDRHGLAGLALALAALSAVGLGVTSAMLRPVAPVAGRPEPTGPRP
jgi:predicted MFS family arabinose efflux permease